MWVFLFLSANLLSNYFKNINCNSGKQIYVFKIFFSILQLIISDSMYDLLMIT